MTMNQNQHSATAEFATTMTFPEATTTTTTTCTMATNDHRHEWGRQAAGAIVVLSLPTTFVLRTGMMMTTMRTGS